MILARSDILVDASSSGERFSLSYTGSESVCTSSLFSEKGSIIDGIILISSGFLRIVIDSSSKAFSGFKIGLKLRSSTQFLISKSF
jgi:hypothetical protein